MPTVLRFICFLLAFVCFLVSAVRSDSIGFSGGRRSFGLIALGLAFFVAPFLWGAAEALE